MDGLRVHRGYLPGAIGRIAELHARYYAEHWGFGAFFEARVARELAEFVLRYDPGEDGLWTVSRDGRVEASLAIDARGRRDAGGSQLRWFIVSDALRGTGAGGALLDDALAWCRARGHRAVQLWTFEGLSAARHLYEKAGFRLAEQQAGDQWGREVVEQRFVLALDSPGPG